jgi:hypothetical protein
MTRSRPTSAGYHAAAHRLIEGGSAMVRWNSIRASARARYVTRRIREWPGTRPGFGPGPATNPAPESASSRYRATSSAAAANCRGKCAYQPSRARRACTDREGVQLLDSTRAASAIASRSASAPGLSSQVGGITA